MASVPDPEELKLVQLYGGALTCQLPSSFQDVRYIVTLIATISLSNWFALN